MLKDGDGDGDDNEI